MSQTIAVVTAHDASADMALATMQFAPATRAFISVPCTGLDGTLDGVLTFYAVNGGAKSVIGTITLDVADNSDDVHSISFSGNPEELGYEYAANGCTGGTFDIVATRDQV